MKRVVMKYLFFILLMSAKANCQEKNLFSIGIGASYRIYGGCLFIDYSFLSSITLTCEFSDGKYSGFGIGPSISFYPLQNTKLKPLLYVSYLRTLGARFSYSRGNDVLTTIKTTDANYVIPMVGLRYNDKGGDQRFKNYFSYILKVGYKVSASGTPEVILVDGPSYTDKQAKIEKYRNNGIVASLSLVFNFGKKNNTSILK